MWVDNIIIFVFSCLKECHHHQNFLLTFFVLFQFFQPKEPPIFIFTAQDFESDRIFVNAGGNGQLLKNESFKIADGGGLILSVDLFDLLPIDKETEEFLGSSDDQPISNREFEING